jgi:hypothetical protein
MAGKAVAVYVVRPLRSSTTRTKNPDATCWRSVGSDAAFHSG